MQVDQIRDPSSWTKLLEYYTNCLREENRLRYVIGSRSIRHTCWFLTNLDGSFLRDRSSGLSIQSESERSADKLQTFVLGEANSRPPSVCFGYPFYLGTDGKLMPLLYVAVSGRRAERGVRLTCQSPDIEINFAALWEVLPGDQEVSLDAVLGRFEDLEVREGESPFDRTLDLLLSCLEELAGHPIDRLGRGQFNPGLDLRRWPRGMVIESPLLFHIREGYTNHLLRELNGLQGGQKWSQAEPSLHQLLNHSDGHAYPSVPERAGDRHLYLAPANDRQRQAIVASEHCPIAVVTGPPGTGKSQLILNIVGNAVLRGETVLIASRNNKAVDVVHDRFFSRVDYPGIARTGKRDLRRRLPGQMRRAFAAIRGGGTTSRLETVQAEHRAVLKRIDEQHKTIAVIERLQHDRGIYIQEVNDLLTRLPETLRACVRGSKIRLVDQDGNQLGAALRSMLDETENVIDARSGFGESLRSVLLSNAEELEFLSQLEVAEQRLRLPLGLRPAEPADASFSALGACLSVWESLPRALLLQDDVILAKEAAKVAGDKATTLLEGLAGDLALEVASASKRYEAAGDMSQVHTLKQILEEARDAQAVYVQLGSSIGDLRAESRAIDWWLKRLVEASPARPEAPDLAVMEQFHTSRHEVLIAHRAGAARADLARGLELLRRERNTKTAEFREVLARLDGRISVARAKVPAVLLPRVEAAIEAADRRTWKRLARALSRADAWATRVEAGDLTMLERIKRILVRDWASKTLKRTLSAIDNKGAEKRELTPVEEPAMGASFGDRIAYLHRKSSFARVCALTAERTYGQEMFLDYETQSEREITKQFASLQDMEAQFEDSLVRIPAAVSEAMLSNDWPFDRIDASVLHELDEVRDQCDELLSSYREWIGRLDCLLPHSSVAEAFGLHVDALKHWAESPKRPAPQPATPKSVVVLISTWLRFLEATEAECEAARLREELALKEEASDSLWAELPKGMRHITDWSQIPHSSDIMDPVAAQVTDLRRELDRQIDRWEMLQQRAVDVLQRNALKSPALDKVLKRATREQGHFSDLIAKAYSGPEALDKDLHLWQQVVRIWTLQAQLARAAAELGRHPALEEARQTLSSLLDKHLQLGGQALAEKWRDVASGLEPSALRSIDSYISTLEDLAKDRVSNYGALRRRADEHFSDALKLFPVWLTTNLSTQDIPLQAGVFDLVVIDEASQCDIPSAIPLLFRGKRLVIIGDENQLTHIATLPNAVNRQISEKLNIGIGTQYDYKLHSLFRLAARSVNGSPGDIFLNEHYRSCEEIISFANRFYPEDFDIKTEMDGVPALYQEIGCGVYWLDINGVTERPGAGRIYNQDEVKAVRYVIDRLNHRLGALLDPALQQQKKPPATIGVVTPFREQANRLQRTIGALNLAQDRALVGTVHTYQGDERDVMVFSVVATEEMPEGTYGFMARDMHLLNVAVTRARLTLIIVGDHEFFMRRPKRDYYRELAEYAGDLKHVYARIDQVPLFQPQENSGERFELGIGKVVRPGTPYSNRRTLRQILALCEKYIWWYDPYMSGNALDALSLVFEAHSTGIEKVRLLTVADRWDSKKRDPTKCVPRKEIRRLKQELGARGVVLQLAILPIDPGDPPPHDRYLFAANQAVDMPPINTIYSSIARISEFTVSSLTSGDFESWWQKANVVVE